MKKSCLIVFLLSSLLSCTRNDKNVGPGNSIAPRVKRQVMEIAIDYARDKFKESKKTVAKDGIITIGDNQISYVIDHLNYVIDPARILVGLIDDDSNKDAIVSIASYKGQYLVLTEHLILIKTDGKFMLNRVIESDMKIMGIKERVITAEISTHSPDSPLYNCSSCKEIVNYQFRGGDLIRME
ncbi:MAG: hypothetical protein WC854_06585 [Bacteroidales bacterium]